METRSLLRGIEPGTLVYSTGETWGLPVGLAAHAVRARIKHVVYVHRVFTPRWLSALHTLSPYLRVDGWVCVTDYQARLLRGILGPEARVIAISQGVDTQFWDPTKAKPSAQEPYLLSVGTEMRDYPLLFDAVKGMGMRVIVKASSAWMRKTRHMLRTPPPNVQVLTERLSYVGMRDLYAGASLVVVPLLDTPQAAGITTILEAMAMGKCVVATESQGLPDVLVDRGTGRIAHRDPRALREVVDEACSNSHYRDQVTEKAQVAVRRTCSLEGHSESVAGFLCATHKRRSGTGHKSRF